jgi:hypothetical protein
VTIVNAGFSRGAGKKTEWRNVTGITVPMDRERLGDMEFRLLVERHRPEPGFALQGYCLV